MKFIKLMKQIKSAEQPTTYMNNIKSASSEVVDKNGKKAEEGMWLYKPMVHNTFRGGIPLRLFQVKIRHQKDGVDKPYLLSENKLITKGISHVKDGILFDTYEEAKQYSESHKTKEEKEFDKLDDWQKVDYYLSKQSAEQPTTPKPTAQLPQNMEYVWDPKANQWIAVMKDNPSVTPPTYNPNQTNMYSTTTTGMTPIKSSLVECLNNFIDGERYSKEIKIEAGLIKGGFITYSGFDMYKGTKYSITQKGLEYLKQAAQQEYDLEKEHLDAKKSYLLDGISESELQTGDVTYKGLMPKKTYSIFEINGEELAKGIEASSEVDAKVKFTLQHPEYKDSQTIYVKESGKEIDANYSETTDKALTYPSPSISPSTDIELENHDGWVNTASSELLDLHNILTHLKMNELADVEIGNDKVEIYSTPELINTLEHQIKDSGLHCQVTEESKNNPKWDWKLTVFLK